MGYPPGAFILTTNVSKAKALPFVQLAGNATKIVLAYWILKTDPSNNNILSPLIELHDLPQSKFTTVAMELVPKNEEYEPDGCQLSVQ
ncbi:hypothetical protein DICVIV_08734 [Dictyocaulus viviparus]|uniref:Uncharacterized protein n=1 Tax=Dictyocaulus viviparus TaxID=29172 RepID=A0A0D8XND3_DICVI|nr:hypothetical protein DICVIV_08734 [Dictyocaulus viviparus]